MSLDLLKQRFNVKHPTSETEKELEFNKKLVEDLKIKSTELSRQISLLENENSDLTTEVSKLKREKDGSISINEVEYKNKLDTKDSDILSLKLDINSLYEQIDTRNKKINFKNKIINESLEVVKTAKNKIDNLKNQLKLNENKSSKITKKLKLEIEENYNEYLINLKVLNDSIEDNKKNILDKKQKLKNSLKEIKTLNKNISVLQEKNDKNKETINKLNKQLNKLNDSFDLKTKRVEEKNQYIYQLKNEISDLNDKIRIIENFRYKNKEFDKSNPNIKSLIELLQGVSKEKQKMQVMDWNQWKDIPENKYLIELDIQIAEQTFKSNNFNAQSIQDKYKARMRGEEGVPTKLRESREAAALLDSRNAINKYITTAIGFAGDYSSYTVDTQTNRHTIRHPESGNKATGSTKPLNYAWTLTGSSDSVDKLYNQSVVNYTSGLSSFDDTVNLATSASGYNGGFYFETGSNSLGTIDGTAYKSNSPWFVGTDSDGIKYGWLLSNSGSVSESGTDDDDTIVSLDLSNHTNQDDAGLRAIDDAIMCSQATDEKTYVIVLEVPSIKLGGENLGPGTSGRQNTNLGSRFTRYNMWGLRKRVDDSDGNGNAWGWKMNMLLQDGNANDKKLYFRFGDGSNQDNAVNNGLGTHEPDDNEVYTDTALDMDRKYVVFLRVDRPNGKMSISLNDSMQDYSDIDDNDNQVFGPSLADYDSKVTDIQFSPSRGKVPEWKLYDMKIIQKLLSEDEQKVYYNQMKEVYKVQ